MLGPNTCGRPGTKHGDNSLVAASEISRRELLPVPLLHRLVPSRSSHAVRVFIVAHRAVAMGLFRRNRGGLLVLRVSVDHRCHVRLICLGRQTRRAGSVRFLDTERPNSGRPFRSRIVRTSFLATCDRAEMSTAIRRVVESGMITAACHLLMTYTAYHTHSDVYELSTMALVVVAGITAIGFSLRFEKGFWKYYPTTFHALYFAWMVMMAFKFFSGEIP